MPTEEVTIKINADVSDFKKSMGDLGKDAKKQGQKIKKNVAQAESSASSVGGRQGPFRGFSLSIDNISEKLSGIGAKAKDAFAGIKDKAGGALSGLGEKMKGKGGIMAIVTAIAGAITLIVGKLSKKFAQMWDPVGAEKATAKMQASIRKMQTSLGALLKPLYTFFTNFISWIADKITSFVESLLSTVAYIQGVLGIGYAINETLEGSAESLEEASEMANGALQAFDKLNVMDASQMGDVEQAEHINKLMNDARKQGADVRHGISGAFSNMIKGIQDVGAKAWKSFTDIMGRSWQVLTDIFTQLYDKIRSVFEGVWNAFISLGRSAVDGLTGVWDTVKSAGKGIWDTIVNAGEGAWDALSSLGTSTFDEIGSVGTGIWAHIKEAGSVTFDNLKGMAGAIWSSFQSLGGKAWNVITGFGRSFADSVRGIFEGVFNSLKGAFNVIMKPIKDTIGTLIDSVKWLMEQVQHVGGSVSNAVGGLGGKISGGLSWITSKLGFASGGVIEPNNPHMVLVGDNKAEREIISPLSTMKQAFKEALSELGGYGGGSSEVVIKLDSKVLARQSFDAMRNEAMRRGGWA